MRHFEPDETTEVAVTLTKKDWLMVLHLLKRGMEDLSDNELRHQFKQVSKDIIDQAKR